MSSNTSNSGLTVHTFGSIPITCHAFANAKGDTVAISKNNKEVEIHSMTGSKWVHKCTLDQHDLRVTGIDWAPKTNRIVTCSSDRNAYVWNPTEGGKWKHSLVLLRINRAATCVKWSPLENKFAVGSGARLISVCHFEEENDWWVARHIKKPIRSTITALDWHPNNSLLAAGSTDFKVRVFSAYIKEQDEKPAATVWGAKMPFQQLMAEFANSDNNGGWVHAVSFSADGNMLAWVGHDSSVSVATGDMRQSTDMTVFRLKLDLLPLLSCVWISKDMLVAGGHDCTLFLYSIDSSSGVIKFVSKLEEDKKGGAVDAAKFSAKAMFMIKDRTGGDGEVGDAAPNTVHQNYISCLRIMSGDKSKAEKLSTTGADGKMVVWDLKVLEKKVKGLKF